MPLLQSIPVDLEDGFKELGKITDEEFENLISRLESSEYYPALGNLADSVGDDEKLFKVGVQEILESVGNLQTSIDSKEVIEEIVNDIVFLSQTFKLITKKNKDSFEKRIRILIVNEKIYYAAKADNLITNYSNSYIKSRVVSDIRPIFDMGDAEEPPKAGVILHNITIHYNSSDEPFHKDITLCLTSYDIKNLQSVLKRAEKKEIALRSIFEKLEMKNLND